MHDVAPQRLRFGAFEVDLKAGELWKHGHRLRVQEKPFQILQALLEHPGETLNRQELRERLWPAETFVDFDKGLNSAVNKLRAALGDSAEAPRFIETVGRRGYRFIGTLQEQRPQVEPDAPPSDVSIESVARAEPAGSVSSPASDSAPAPAPATADDHLTLASDPHIIDNIATVPKPRRTIVLLAASALLATAIGAWQLAASGSLRLTTAGRPAPMAQPHAAPQTGKTPRPEVYELFQQGRFHQRQESPASLARAVEYFEQAIARDPDFALGYAGLASARHDQAVWGTASRDGVGEKVRHATLKALALAPDLPEAHMALGVSLFYYDWDWVGAETAFKRAIQLNPGLSWSHTQYAYLLMMLGRFDEAAVEAEKAVAIDPLEPNSLCAAGRALFGARRPAEAEAYYKRALALEPGFGLALDMLTNFYLLQRRLPEAAATLERLRHLASHRSIASLEMRYELLSGQPGKALRYLKSLDDGTAPRANWRLAMGLYMLLGDHDRALWAIERSVAARGTPLWPGDAEFDPLRGDSRFQSLLERMNLPKDSIARLVQRPPAPLVKAATE